MPEETIHEAKRSRSRQALATYFRRIAEALGRGEPVPIDDAGTVTVDPAAESDVEIELEREDGVVHFEVGVEFDEADGEIDVDAAASKATFELYADSADQWRWRLRHDNGNIVADGGEGYADKRDAKSGIESVQRNAPGAHVIDVDRGEEAPEDGGSDAAFELFRDSDERYRWRLRHDNGNIIADGGQGYASKQKAKQGLNSVKFNAPGASVEELDADEPAEDEPAEDEE
ncbi:HVO_2922 family protein [Halorubrum sp. AD140]|uniref:HVO_2922 family protein n=1 Tax=Halorubrum sp. AD140 TaxID=3050073 RepID=UPI002ACC6893|nr:HVO_2922 family protein [Halorubrum sp. AD140]MDZ5811429.1 HVO_2922 family protein [Halorubrum sp. AD140]